jgi:phage baseplate assembly protein W
MIGMNSESGRQLDGIAHIEQSVGDILATPIGSRVMRREYGSLLPELMDQPMTDANLLRVYAAAVMSILRWEPRIRVQAIARVVSTETPGTASFTIEAQNRNGESISLQVPFV